MQAPQPSNNIVSLCAPSPDLTCFGCCPPIRPSHYDPLDYVGSLRREFVDNRREFLKHGPQRRPIVGRHCWALGFLDAAGRRVGCLLHPFQNQGEDLRFLIDYGNKCMRENCVSARMFDLLPEEGRLFWLPLARGLSAFTYSSRRSNPLFHLALWGPDVLEPLRRQAIALEWSVTELLLNRPCLIAPIWNPQAHRYLMRLSLESDGPQTQRRQTVEDRCHILWLRTLSIAKEYPESSPLAPYTHQLPMESDFLDLLRLGLGRRKIVREHAEEIRERLRRLALEFN